MIRVNAIPNAFLPNSIFLTVLYLQFQPILLQYFIIQEF